MIWIGEGPSIYKRYYPGYQKGFYVEVNGERTYGFHEDLAIIVKKYIDQGYHYFDESQCLFPKPEKFKRKK